MAARYPANTMSFDYRANVTDLIQAQDVNVLYDEVSSVGTYLGQNPHISATWGNSAFTSGTTTWESVAARIQNIENGVYTGINSRVHTDGGSTIQPSTSSVVGLIVKATSGQSVNLFESQTSGSSTAVTKIDKDGVLYYNGSVVATISGTETLTNKTLTGATIDGSLNTLSKVPATAVIATGTTDIKTYVDAKPTVYYQTSAPSTGLKDGDIWVDSDSVATSFDSSTFLTTSSASVTSGYGFHRITASTSAPTSGDGANGDVWLQYV
jgi:hypothetical protein